MELRDCFIWGHRGASARAPENTMAAFRLAEEAGVDGIELDVHLSRDKIPVVIHDERVERTTDGQGPVARLSLKELRRLDAGGWFAQRFAGEKLPTLEEVLQWAGSRLRLNVEIKSDAAAAAVLELMNAYPQVDILVSSFNHALLLDLRHQDPNLPVAFLCDSLFWRPILRKAIASKSSAFHPSTRVVSRTMVVAAHRAGLVVHTWTVDDPGVARKLLRAGCSGVFTNDPQGLKRC